MMRTHILNHQWDAHGGRWYKTYCGRVGSKAGVSDEYEDEVCERFEAVPLVRAKSATCKRCEAIARKRGEL